MRKEIRVAGFGGQGVALAGYILGKALALYEGLEAVMTQSYGPEARGGASSASIVVSDREIAYPFVQSPDVLIAFSQEAYTKFLPLTREESIILLDEELVKYETAPRYFGIPATRLAQGLGRRIVANVVMLGFFASVTDLVGHSSLEEAIRSSVKSKTVPLNLEALNVGYQYAIDKEMAQ